AAPWRIAPGENMVMLPPESMAMEPLVAPAAPQAPVAPIDDVNMVSVPPAKPVAAAAPAAPEDAALNQSITGPSYVEAGVNFYNVTDDQGDWFGQFLTAQVQTDPKNRWNTQVQHQKAFHDTGTFVGVGNTHTFDDRWFTDVGFGIGSNTFILPRYRADAAINRKLLPDANLIATFGGTWLKASETYTSYGLFSGLSYYFDGPWNAQVGIRSDRSTPGGVYATSGFGAVTYGYQKRHYLTGRVGYGREAYQLLGAGNITNAFNSNTFGLNWRQWIGESWGYNIGSEYYHNPTYNRTGGTFSLFKEF
ncbi:MAG: YaiO family outer membrane beta-barrel protein, partial [Alphaproteobacteria bacterium]|nr:YaiO family outer membrane beta-barrel protein [Alphaproteobacteria bacterium]